MFGPLSRFKRVVFEDTEFIARPGERPDPVCVVIKEWPSQQIIRLRRDEVGACPPYSLGRETLFVSYFAPAEINVHRVLGWGVPERILDLYVEYRNRFNCLPTIIDQKPDLKGDEEIGRNTLRGALIQFGIDCSEITKQELLALARRGRPFMPAEEQVFVDACERDVVAVERLFWAMLDQIDMPRAIYRGSYQESVSAMEHNGVPIDVPTLDKLRARWGPMQKELIAKVDSKFGVYDGTAFREERFERLLAVLGIVWPRYPSGHLMLDEGTFRDMCKVHPELNPLRELRSSLSQMRLQDLEVGHDGFNRCLLSSFSTRTSRHAPSSNKFVFCPSVWERGLIKPPPGYGVAYIDWRSMEIGVAAALSGDEAMQSAYSTGDVYLGFAKLVEAVPDDATKETHPRERELYKQCMLATNYGMEEFSLALRIEKPLLVARSLLQQHHDIFRRYWEWSNNRVHGAMLHGITYTVFGWRCHVTAESKVTSIRNFPVQANAAEVLRLAISLSLRNGITVCCPIHDAVLIMAPLDRLDSDIEKMRGFMQRAGEIVLDGFKLQTDFTAVRYPDRYMDEVRGRPFWNMVMSLL